MFISGQNALNTPLAPHPSVRTANVDDAAAIAHLSAQLGYPADTPTFARRLSALLALPTHTAFVFDRGDADLLGFAGAEHRLMLESGERVEIVGLVVDAGARRSGVGRALIAAVEAWTRERGLDTVFLRSNVVRPEAHPFYEGLGYARIKTQHAYARRVA